MSSAAGQVLIQPRNGWQSLDVSELWRYRELLGFLIWRDITIRYKQTVLGGIWAIIQPLVGMIIFGLLFSRVLQPRTDGPPYLLFVYAGLVPWTFFANAVALSSNSLIGSEQMIRKIYFPRLMVPLGMVIALGLDMLVSFAVISILMAWYHWAPSLSILWLPFWIAVCCMSAAGFGLLLSALNVQYRDVKYVVPFCLQMALFLTPVIYPPEYLPERIRTLLVFNPMAGIVEGFRYALLGTPLSDTLVLSSITMSAAVFILGLFFFRRMERRFADVI